MATVPDARARLAIAAASIHSALVRSRESHAGLRLRPSEGGLPSKIACTTDALAGIFSDRSLVQAMLDFEAALARAEAKAGMIPARAAASIATAANADGFDAAAIARDARASGTVSIPLVKALTARVQAADAESARYVHFGATSQDVADSAMASRFGALARCWRPTTSVSSASFGSCPIAMRGTVMLGRTFLQPAPPITFGLKVAGWAAALARGWMRFERACDEAAILQFGGASGTLAALGDRGPAVAARARRRISGCALPRRRGIRTGIAWPRSLPRAAIYTGTLGKVARDVSLLMQDEVGEVAEPGGGSSTMPHKRNPAGCASRAGRGDAAARSRGGVPDRHGAGARARRRRLARRVADDRSRPPDHRLGARGDGRRAAGCPSMSNGCAPTSSGPTAQSSRNA